MKIQSYKLSDEERIQTLDALYTAASTLKGRDAMKRFLRDLLTESERIMLGRRILIAQKLLMGNACQEIAEEMHVGNDTVYRVERWLHDQMPGYAEAIAGLNQEMDRREEKRRVGRMYADKSWSGVLAQLKHKYPLHFLLVPWPAGHVSKRETHTQKKPVQKRKKRK